MTGTQALPRGLQAGSGRQRAGAIACAPVPPLQRPHSGALFMSLPASLCLYCGSKPGQDPAYAEAAQALGRFVAQAGIRLVYGGGRVGLMGAAADACLEAGGEVIGIIPDFLMRHEV